MALAQAWQTWAGLSALSVTGLLPKVGPARAISLALRSRLFFKPETESVRAEDAARLRGLLTQVDLSKQAYIEVVGPKGIGKSVLIDTVLKRKAGLVEVNVGPGENMKDLVAMVHRQIGGYRALGKSDGDAKRVMFMFKVFGARPTVVFRVRERSAGDKFAQITSATRTLVGEGYRIIIDASPNSVEPEAMTTKRQLLLEMEEMSREVMLREAEFEAMFERLQKVALDELVWQTLGGVPASISKLANELKGVSDELVRPIVEKVVKRALQEALASVRKCPVDVKAKILPLFAEKDSVPISTAEKLGIAIAAAEIGSDKVLRNRKEQDALVPASPEVAFVLRHRFYDDGMFEKMQSFDYLCDVAKKST